MIESNRYIQILLPHQQICVHTTSDATQPIAVIIPHEHNLRRALWSSSSFQSSPSSPSCHHTWRASGHSLSFGSLHEYRRTPTDTRHGMTRTCYREQAEGLGNKNYLSDVGARHARAEWSQRRRVKGVTVRVVFNPSSEIRISTNRQPLPSAGTFTSRATHGAYSEKLDFPQPSDARTHSERQSSLIRRLLGETNSIYAFDQPSTVSLGHFHVSGDLYVPFGGMASTTMKAVSLCMCNHGRIE